MSVEYTVGLCDLRFKQLNNTLLQAEQKLGGHRERGERGGEREWEREIRQTDRNVLLSIIKGLRCLSSRQTDRQRESIHRPIRILYSGLWFTCTSKYLDSSFRNAKHRKIKILLWRWQVTYVALHEMTWYDAWLYGIHRTRRDCSSFTWHQRCNNQTAL